MVTPDDERAAAAARKERMDGLGEQATVVRTDVDHLEAQGIVDRELIAHLEADGVADRDKIANLEVALISARRIGAAMGILMATQKITDAQAFDALRTASQRQHRKLRDVAEQVLLTGALPGKPTDG